MVTLVDVRVHTFIILKSSVAALAVSRAGVRPRQVLLDVSNPFQQSFAALPVFLWVFLEVRTCKHLLAIWARITANYLSRRSLRIILVTIIPVIFSQLPLQMDLTGSAASTAA